MQSSVPHPKAVKRLISSALGRSLLTSVVLSVCSVEAVRADDRASTPPSAQNQENSPLPVAADLRPVFEELGLERRKQGKRGTCSVFTVVGALEFALNQENKPERLSVEFLNWAANQIHGSANDGGLFSEMWKGFEAYGICTDEEMPYRAYFDPATFPEPQVLLAAKSRVQRGLNMHWIKRWDVSTGLSEPHLIAIRKTLSQGWPVCAGLRWPKGEKWKDDVLQMCGPEAVFDGHSVLLVGYKEDETQLGGGIFIFRNTSNSGRDGFMPYAYAREYMNDALWIEARRTAAKCVKSGG